MAVPARAERFVIDLASGVPAATVSRPVGTVLTFVVRNRLPKMEYRIVVETRSIAIPQLEELEGVGSFKANDPCAPLAGDIAKVFEATDERTLGPLMEGIRTADKTGICQHNPAIAKALRDTIAATEIVVDGEYEVRAGEEIIVTVSRGEKAWVRTVSGGPRGKWLTTYGASVVQDRSERMFLKSDGANGFVVTKETEPAGPRVIPSVYFTWMSSTEEGRNWIHGPTAGLGIDDKAPGLFAGWSATYNHNLTFLAGAALAQHKRLRGQYTEGDKLAQTLTEDQLLEGVYRPTFLIGLTFRFGDNPFGEPTSQKPAGGSGESGKERD
ncbi:MAG: hypothetical protein WD690_07905 [Vicinamibacterales bacterium]